MSDELTQMVLIVVVLIVAYAGLKAWTKRSGQGGDAGGAGSTGLGTQHEQMLANLEAEIEVERPKSRKERNEERFTLTGKDAEAAAKVLKRMLKQDQK